MSSSKKYKKHGRRIDDLVISDDINSSESYAGNGQHNILTQNDSCDCDITNSQSFNGRINRNFSHKSNIVIDSKFVDELKFSPEFHVPMKDNSIENSNRIQNAAPRAIKSSKFKSPSNANTLPALNVKKLHVDRDPIDSTRSKTINDQIEKIENRKQKITLVERKHRMKEIMAKGRQNWSTFKAEIDFIKSVEANNIIPPYNTGDIIKNEKSLNHILYELTESIDSLTPAGTVTSQAPCGDERSVPIVTDSQEFKSVIKPMLRSYPSNAIDEDLAMSLKQILFSSTSRSWGAEWYRQNIEFHSIDSKLPFGMIQRTEGPNSVMCAIQAEFLIEALYHGDHSMNWISNVKSRRNNLLAAALTRIICRCRPPQSEYFYICLLDVSLKGRTLGTVKSDGITECLVVHKIPSKADLQQFISHHISQFVDKFCPGVILLVVSCLLTHELANCLQELSQDNQRLVSPLGFPREELTNLLLIGNITSHYFNDTVQILDDCGNYLYLRGVPSRSSVGMLSSEAHCAHCKEIGTFLKTPKYPIWLSKLGENNYVILYCENGNLVNDWKAEIKFQLNLYCPLMAKSGVIKMTIDSSVSQSEKCRMQEEERRREREKENHNKEITEKRLKNMSDDALRFVLDNESVDEYLGAHSDIPRANEDINVLERIIHSKWPNADILPNDDRFDRLSFLCIGK